MLNFLYPPPSNFTTASGATETHTGECELYTTSDFLVPTLEVRPATVGLRCSLFTFKLELTYACFFFMRRFCGLKRQQVASVSRRL